MKSSVVIKGCKSGMTVILNPDTPFEQLLEDVGKKFKEIHKKERACSKCLCVLSMNKFENR